MTERLFPNQCCKIILFENAVQDNWLVSLLERKRLRRVTRCLFVGLR
jgi:hypothetical protein